MKNVLHTLTLVCLFACSGFAQTVSMISDINPGATGSNPMYLGGKVYSSKLYFRAENATSGGELFSYDGSTVSLVSDFVTGSGGTEPKYLTVHSGKLYYSGYTNSNGEELISYDGTTVAMASDINSGSGYGSPYFITSYGSNIYFQGSSSTYGGELFGFDGSSSSLTADIWNQTPHTGSTSNPQNLCVYSGNLYFRAWTPTVGDELRKYDGSSVSLVADFYTGSNGFSPSDLIVFNSKLYMQGQNAANGGELFVYDGSSISLAADIESGSGSSGPTAFAVYNNKLYFQANTTANGYELWSYDGTTASLAADISSGAGSSYPSHLFASNGKLYFRATDGVNGFELWQYDGTTASMVANINPSGNSNPGFFIEYNNIIYFQANDGTNGGELWRIDPPNPTITSLTPSSPYCAGASVSVAYNAGGSYNSGNVFTVQLSNSSGSFASPTSIGTVTSTTSGTISATIPGGTATGSGYRMRIVSSNPSAIGTDNGANLTINASVTPSVSIAASPNGAICSNTSVTFTATPTNGGGTPNYDFKVNGSSVQNSTTDTYTTTSLTNGNTVTCDMTSNATCPSSATVTSNTITMTVTVCANTWTGNSNTDWNNNGNWSSGSFPTGSGDATIPTTPTGGVFPIINTATAAVDDITIQSGATVNIPSGNALTVNGVLTNNGTITVQSGGSLVQATGSTLAGSGTYNISRTGTSSTTKFNYWSSPITNGTLPGSNGYRYNSATGTHSNTDDNPGPDPGWVSFSGTMTTAKGYASVAGGAATFSGTVNNGTLNTAVTTSAQIPTSLSAPSYFNLVGNPYPSSVNVTTFLSDNSIIDGTVWFWDDDNSGGTGYTSGDYATRTGIGGTAGGGGTTPNGNIGSCQGFFVKANSNGNVSFNNAQRGTNNTQFLKTEEEISRIWLNMYNDTTYNEILVAFVSDATEGYDNNYDGYKFRGNPYIAFAAQQQGDEFAIAAFPSVESERIIPLTTYVANEGIYTITNKEDENMDNTTVYLEDRFLNSFTNLENNGTYTTLINTANSVDRFYLHFAPAIVTGINENNPVNIIAYITAGELTVMFGNISETQGTFNIIDMTGKTVYTQANVNLTGNVYRTDVSSLASGIYAISFVTDNAVYNKKILVK